jgi:hypothetical protein
LSQTYNQPSMKKALLSLIFASVCAFGAFAGNAEVFNLDEQEINSEFAQLNELEQFVNANEGITLAEISAGNPLLANVSNSADILGVLSSLSDPPLGIPSILWGFCFGVVGIAIVYFVADDRDETKKAFVGCAIAGGLYIVFWVVYILVLGNAFWFFG